MVDIMRLKDSWRVFCPLIHCGWFYQHEDKEQAIEEERKHWESYHAADPHGG